MGWVFLKPRGSSCLPMTGICRICFMVVQNLTSLVHKTNYYFCLYGFHEEWNPDDLSSPDVGTLQIYEGSIFRWKERNWDILV